MKPGYKDLIKAGFEPAEASLEDVYFATLAAQRGSTAAAHAHNL
jgi:hypothetical protein